MGSSGVQGLSGLVGFSFYMGAYLSSPKTAKVVELVVSGDQLVLNCYQESSDGRGGFHSWGCSEVQGWRTEMEDAHVAISGLEGSSRSADVPVDDTKRLVTGTSGGVAMFGVYDGHGGCEVAKFVEKHLPEEVAEKSCYLVG